MTPTRRLTLTVTSAFIVITATLLWTGASSTVTGQTRSALTFGSRSLTGLASQGGPLAFVQGLFDGPWRGFDTGTLDQGFGPRSFALGDLDGDGDIDILVGDSFFGSPGVSVLKNNGDQTFAAPVY
jgi:hypothetical protein